MNIGSKAIGSETIGKAGRKVKDTVKMSPIAQHRPET